ncbi:MAG: ferrochelatase [Gemmatales bacterium]|nr:MAG: ferrochelatase [Gemmatales bacterium]
MVGVLLIQLGTPEAPTVPAVREYLRQFLSDPRVIEAPRWLWWLILHFRILRTRPRESAEKYRRIWNEETGSPLLYFTQKQTETLQREFPQALVRFGMQVGQPSVRSVVRDMIAAGVDRLIVLPMYPQYSATTTASATDALFSALLRERRVPALRIIPPYYAHPSYLDAVAQIIRHEQDKLGWEPEHFLLSFHGIPVAYVERGDPYPDQVRATAEALAPKLGWPEDRWTLTYQSRFGRDVWLQPYTDETLQNLARAGVKRVFVATPGFTTDCLETIDEIGFEAKETFRQAGGELLHQCRCLNDHPAWISAMKTLIVEEGQGWW